MNKELRAQRVERDAEGSAASGSVAELDNQFFTRPKQYEATEVIEFSRVDLGGFQITTGTPIVTKPLAPKITTQNCQDLEFINAVLPDLISRYSALASGSSAPDSAKLARDIAKGYTDLFETLNRCGRPISELELLLGEPGQSDEERQGWAVWVVSSVNKGALIGELLMAARDAEGRAELFPPNGLQERLRALFSSL